jgi:nitrate reductase NapAB chaperone NapD
MAICGYLVLAEPGAAPRLADRIAALPGCEVVALPSRDLILLVTESSGPAQDAALRARLAALEKLAHLQLVFGELDAGLPAPVAPSGR